MFSFKCYKSWLLHRQAFQFSARFLVYRHVDNAAFNDMSCLCIKLILQNGSILTWSQTKQLTDEFFQSYDRASIQLQSRDHAPLLLRLLTLTVGNGQGYFFVTVHTECTYWVPRDTWRRSRWFSRLSYIGVENFVLTANLHINPERVKPWSTWWTSANGDIYFAELVKT